MEKENIKNFESGQLGREGIIALLELQALSAGFMKRAFIKDQIVFLRDEIRWQEENGERKKLSDILFAKKRRLEIENFIDGNVRLGHFHINWMEKVGVLFRAIGE